MSQFQTTVNSETIHQTYQSGLAAKLTGERGGYYKRKTPCKKCGCEVNYVSTRNCRDCQRGCSIRYNSRNKEAYQERARDHYHEYKDAKRPAASEEFHYIRAKEMNCVSCKYDKADKAKCIAFYRLRCEINKDPSKEQHSVDHVIPLSRGGAHHSSNLRVVTQKENSEKWSSLDIDLIEEHFGMSVDDIPQYLYPDNDLSRMVLAYALQGQKLINALKEGK